MTFKAVGTGTQGHLGLFENLIHPGGTAPGVHIHRHMEEMFYVLEGKVEILVGNQTVQGQPGAFVLVPRETSHAFARPGNKSCKAADYVLSGGRSRKKFLRV